MFVWLEKVQLIRATEAPTCLFSSIPLQIATFILMMIEIYFCRHSEKNLFDSQTTYDHKFTSK